jgi:1,4-alpha-glucan branching enzyme
VHGKRSLLEKMPGDNWQKFANLRLFFGFMFGHPGKKLNFMTNDIAQYNEWNSEISLERSLLELKVNKELNNYCADLSRLYKEHPALYEVDFDSSGFHWIDFSDSLNSVLSFYRISKDRNEMLLFTFNMAPTIRDDYRIGVQTRYWKEIFNSDAEIYGGRDWKHGGKILS